MADDPIILKLSDSCTIIRGDCLPLLPSLAFDALVTDPPYGIAFQHGGNKRSGITRVVNTKPIHGDNEEFDPSHLLALQGYSKAGRNQNGKRTPQRPMALFGPDHYARHIPNIGQWCAWDKACAQGPASVFTDAEFIWMNRRNARNIFHHFWCGAMRAGEENQSKVSRRHPSQKPVELMLWVLQTCRIGLGKIVLDPYMGTGSTGVACLRSGRRFIGIEIDNEYFDLARERLDAELAKQKGDS